MKHSEDTDYLAAFISKMQSAGLPSPVIDTFAYYYHQVIKGESGLVYDRDIRPLEDDVYSEDQSLQINPAREAMKKTDVVKVKLDPRCYGKIDGLDERFGNGIPSLVECDSLTLKGSHLD